VTDANALEFFRQPDIDGALVGGASLKPETFAAILRAGQAATGGDAA
jgi:triosephosphate isomerase